MQFKTHFPLEISFNRELKRSTKVQNHYQILRISAEKFNHYLLCSVKITWRRFIESCDQKFSIQTSN